MKNKVLLFIAISLTTIGFIGLSSILMSEATQNDLYGNVYFKSLYLNNKDNLKNLREEVIKLGESTKSVKKLSNDIAQQTATVSTALKTIQCDNGKVVEDIVNNNRKLFIDCTEKIQTVNAYERERFLHELEVRLNKHTNYYFEKLDEILNSEIFKDLQRSIDTIAINQEKNRKELQACFDRTTLRVESGINSNVGVLENKVKDLSELTFELNQKVKIKINILLTLNAILLIIVIILVVLLIMRSV